MNTPRAPKSADALEHDDSVWQTLRHTPLIWVFLILSLLLILPAWLATRQYVQTQKNTEFRDMAMEAQAAIKQRITDYEHILRGAAGLFNASENVTHKEWEAYIRALEIEEHFPGAQGVGFARLTQKNKAPAPPDDDTTALRAFAITPSGISKNNGVALYLALFAGSKIAAFGDISRSDNTRKTALNRALDSGLATLTGKIMLMQEGQSVEEAGVFMYLPAYHPGLPTQTPNERRLALSGYAFAPIHVHDLMAGVLGKDSQRMTLELYDVAAEDTRELMLNDALATQDPSALSTTLETPIAGRNWVMNVRATPLFEQSTNSLLPWAVLCGGLLSSGLLFSLLLQSARQKRNVQARAAGISQALLNSEDRFKSIVEAMPAGMLIANDAGLITFANRQLADIFGYENDTMTGMSVESLMPEASRPAHVHTRQAFMQNPDRRAMGGGRKLFGLMRNGDAVPVEIALTPLQTNEGQMVVAMVQDIRQRNNVEDQLADAKNKAEAASAAKSEFLANMSHEIRTPLNAVLGMAQLLDNTNLDRTQHEYLGMIHNAGRTLLALLNDILDLAKIESGRMELSVAPFTLGDQLQTLASTMSVSAAQKDLELLIDVHPRVPDALQGDAKRLLQLLINLTSNAIKFTEKGRVSLLVDVLSHKDENIVLRFLVRDTGIGLTDEQVTRLFTPFTQVDSSDTKRFGGTGLGLSICQRLITMMEGDIGVSSTYGQGSDFWFSVPLRCRPRNAAEPVKKRYALVIAKQPEDSSAAQLIIESLGWKYELCNSADAAITRLSLPESPETPAIDTLLVDGGLSEFDQSAIFSGVCILQLPQAPIVLGMSSAYERESIKPMRFDATILKPITAAALQGAITRASSFDGAYVDRIPVVQLQGMRALLVEDNPINQAVALSLLEQAGLIVKIAGDGQQGVDALRTEASNFDVVLMDVQMPVMDGLQATRIIRQELKLDLPIIAMTASVMPAQRSACAAAGMTDFIAKPLELDIVLTTLARHICQRLIATPGLVPDSPVTPPLATTLATTLAMPLAAPAPAPASASAPSPAASTDLPEIEGLDRTEALQRLGNKPALYRMMLEMFVREVESFADTTRGYCTAGDFKSVSRQFHTLKSTAASLGDKHLSEHARHAEQAFSEGLPTDPEHFLAPVEAELTRLMPLIAAALLQSATVPPAAPAAATATAAPTALPADQLRKFTTALKSHDFQAIDIFEAMRTELRDTLGEAAVAELSGAIESLDFERALALLEASAVSC